MHDDLCMEATASKWNEKVVIHCWQPPNHNGDHYDRDLNIYWRRGPGNVVSLGPARRMPWHRRAAKAA